MANTFYKDLLDNLSEGVYFTDRERVINYWNRAAERITGYRAEEVIGSSCKDGILVHVDAAGTNLCLKGCPLARTIDDGRPVEAEVFLHHKDGHRVPVLVRSSAVFGGEGRIVGAVELFADNTRQLAAIQKIGELERIAYVDPLTELPNRRYIEIHLQARYDEMRRYGWPFGVLLMDIDHFKGVNDARGHEAGDAVLKVVARTLRNASRSFDIVGRWGGEEFLAVLSPVDMENLRSIGERFRALVASSDTPVGEGTLRVSISLGGTTCGKRDTVASVLQRADGFLYRSKADGRNRLTVHP